MPRGPGPHYALAVKSTGENSRCKLASFFSCVRPTNQNIEASWSPSVVRALEPPASPPEVVLPPAPGGPKSTKSAAVDSPGVAISAAISSARRCDLVGNQFLHRSLDVLDLGGDCSLEDLVGWCRHVSAGHPANRRVQPLKQLF